MRCGLAALTLVGLLSACAPRILEPGPETGTPHLTDTAFITADGTALPPSAVSVTYRVRQTE